MAHSGGCIRSVPVPNTLKMALEFLDALHKNVGGPQRAVVEELGRQLNTGYNDHITVPLQNVQQNASDLRLRIIGNSKVNSYKDYEPIRNSSDRDQSCVRYIVSILIHILPQLLTTLEFLESKVSNFTNGGWGRQQFGGRGRQSELDTWLTKSSADHGKDELPGGYLPTDLTSNTGNGLHTYLLKLVGHRNCYLVKLCERIKGLETSYPPHKATAQPRGPLPPPPPSPASPQHQSQSHQDGSHPPAEIQPSTAGGDSSTAAIGGAVGATGLVGGSAAVYFLNVGGIRTLIAG
ncbi:ribosome-binding protein 1 [Babesia caballi]|uniref:Ribosome-binding protein 1 n=1 Tax=Babesia caballi TaxID=5871 RepID=A0AAV4LV18_BABCB|nr:ribosome-binding protein 1 [Babesia caballi]